jgi:hypothetical protein
VELVALRRALVELVALRRVAPRAAAQLSHPPSQNDDAFGTDDLRSDGPPWPQNRTAAPRWGGCWICEL